MRFLYNFKNSWNWRQVEEGRLSCQHLYNCRSYCPYIYGLIKENTMTVIQSKISDAAVGVCSSITSGATVVREIRKWTKGENLKAYSNKECLQLKISRRHPYLSVLRLQNLEGFEEGDRNAEKKGKERRCKYTKEWRQELKENTSYFDVSILVN